MSRGAWFGVSGGCLVAALAITLSAELFVRDHPLIHVRWRDTLDEAARAVRERQLRLGSGARVAANTWRYELADTSTTRIDAIISHPDIEDTHYIDRAASVVQPGAPRGPRRAPDLLLLLLVDYAPTILLALAVGATGRAVGLRQATSANTPALEWPVRLDRRILPFGLAAAGAGWLVASFLVGSIPDEEELRWGVLSSFLHVGAIVEGRSPLWSSAVGFGLPQPMVPNFNLHPLAPLLAGMSPAAWVRLLYAAHTVVGALGMWRLARMLQLSPLTSAACVFTFLLASPTQNYALTDLWPSHYVLWTSAPWLLVLAWRLLDSRGRETARLAVLLGLCVGVVAASSHPAHVPVYGTVIVAVAAAKWRQVVARWPALLLAGLLALAITSPNLVQLTTERALFPRHLQVEKLYPDPLPAAARWEAFLRPFPRLDRAWDVDLEEPGTRVLFFGGPFAVLAALGLLTFRLDLALGAAMSTALAFAPLLPMTFVSRYQFRDPALLCAIPLAGLALESLFRSSRTRWLAAALLITQAVVVTLGALPFVSRLWGPGFAEGARLRGATGDSGLADRLVESLPEAGRLAYSEQVDDEIAGLHRLRDGLGENALVYRGVAVVNSTVKGVSTDALWPSPGERLFYGRIRLPRQLLGSAESLDVLGIRYVLARAGERVAPGLRKVTELSADGGDPMVLYENPDGSPGALVIERAQWLPDFPVLDGCPNTGLLCRDLTVLTRLQAADHRVRVTRRDARIDVGVQHAPTWRLLVLAEMFRPGWNASIEDGRLATTSIGPGLLGVMLPPGTTAIRLTYRPALMTSATILSWCALAGSLAALLALARHLPRVSSGPGAV